MYKRLMHPAVLFCLSLVYLQITFKSIEIESLLHGFVEISPPLCTGEQCPHRLESTTCNHSVQRSTAIDPSNSRPGYNKDGHLKIIFKQRHLRFSLQFAVQFRCTSFSNTGGFQICFVQNSH